MLLLPSIGDNTARSVDGGAQNPTSSTATTTQWKDPTAQRLSMLRKLGLLRTERAL